MVGRWSDGYGRKPFLILSFLCGGAQVFALLAYLKLGTSLFWMFPAQASCSAILLVPLSSARALLLLVASPIRCCSLWVPSTQGCMA